MWVRKLTGCLLRNPRIREVRRCACNLRPRARLRWERRIPHAAPANENLVYALPGGGFQPGTRLNFPGTTLPNGTPIVPFGNDSYFITAGSSSYNSMQVSYKHTSGRLQTLIGYTLSKSFDDSSGYGEQINPINHRLSRGLSAFDSTNNFVASYNYTLPIDKLGGPDAPDTRMGHQRNHEICHRTACHDGRNRRPIVARHCLRRTDYSAGGHAQSDCAGCEREPTKYGRPIFRPCHRLGPPLWAQRAMPGGGFSTGRGLTNGILRCLKTPRSPSASICSSGLSFLTSSITLSS